MKPFTSIEGPAVAMLGSDIDTDQILPKQFLRTIERRGLGGALFYDLRHDEAGNRRPEAALNRTNAAILFGGVNFGCGSSREHAAWALDDFGIRCVIAPSFADIFSQNCLGNGILLIPMAADEVAKMAGEATETARFRVDLRHNIIRLPSARDVAFSIEPHVRERLLLGLDEIGQTMSHVANIIAHEDRRRSGTPWLN